MAFHCLTWKLAAEGICLSLSILASIAMIKHQNQKQPWGGKGASLTVSYHSSSLKEVRAGTQGRHQGAGTYAEAMDECCLPTCSS